MGIILYSGVCDLGVVVDSRTLDIDETNHVIPITPLFLLRLTFA